MLESLELGEPSRTVLMQDECYSADGIDARRWMQTVFIPLTMVGDGKTFTIDTEDAFSDHLKALEEKAIELGVAALRTEIQSCAYMIEDMAIISSVRHRLSAKGKVLGSTSITWTVIRVDEHWKINQILFNDAVQDPSVVAQVFLGHPSKRTFHRRAGLS